MKSDRNERRRGNLRTGKPDVSPGLPAHTRGIRQGNRRGSYEKMDGHLPDGTSDAARSTGINAERRNPISADMPNLSPP